MSISDSITSTISGGTTNTNSTNSNALIPSGFAELPVNLTNIVSPTASTAINLVGAISGVINGGASQLCFPSDLRSGAYPYVQLTAVVYEDPTNIIEKNGSSSGTAAGKVVYQPGTVGPFTPAQSAAQAGKSLLNTALSNLSALAPSISLGTTATSIIGKVASVTSVANTAAGAIHAIEKSSGLNQQQQTVANIYLPLPMGVQNSIAPIWDIANQALTDQAVDAIKAITSSIKSGTAMSDAYNASMRGIQNAWNSNGGSVVDSAMDSAVLQYIAYSNAKNAINKISGTNYAANPRKQAVFNGIEPRVFQFDWTLSAQSQQEAQQIEQIIKTITINALPDVAGTDDILFTFPKSWEITFNGVSGFPAISRAVCTGVQTNYSPGGMMNILNDGHAVQVTLTLSFVEMNVRTAKDPGI